MIKAGQKTLQNTPTHRTERGSKFTSNADLKRELDKINTSIRSEASKNGSKGIKSNQSLESSEDCFNDRSVMRIVRKPNLVPATKPILKIPEKSAFVSNTVIRCVKQSYEKARWLRIIEQNGIKTQESRKSTVPKTACTIKTND